MKKTEYVPFRLSIQDRERIDQMATECGVSRSEFLRQLIQRTRVHLVMASTVVEVDKKEQDIPTAVAI